MKPLYAASVVLVAGCSAPSRQPDPESPVAADRLLALRDRAWTDSSAHLAALIEQLDSADPAVRMVAADTLTTLTGEDHGFRYDKPLGVRNAAVDRWAAWLRERIDAGGHTEAVDGDAEPSPNDE